jgi:hypothetical protein
VIPSAAARVDRSGARPARAAWTAPAGICAATAIVALALGCAHGRTHSASKAYLTAAERLAAIKRAQVWSDTDIASVDIKAGPRGHGAFEPGETVTCDYVPEKLGGNSPKFACAITPEDVAKVRYGLDNGEVYAGVASTRLLWALGFGADALYPVHIVCRGCPAELAEDGHPASGEIRFDIAAIERKMRGREMESRDVVGWSWPELDLVDQEAGGASRAHRDALKLLAVLIQHTDSKADQQRLLCVSEDVHKKNLAKCPEPIMMIHDVGQTFGRANLFNRTAVGSVNLEEWKQAPVWKDAKRCVGNLSASQTGTLTDPSISEEGRKFLADLLIQLTDAQLRDLFDVARFPAKPVAQGSRQGTTVDAWVDAFKQKRQEIVTATCPS